nr:GxxExxY protein [uncultured Flavobacterium sp.]
MQVLPPVKYDGVTLEVAFRLDVLGEEKVILEIKSVEELSRLQFKQLLTY